TSTLFPYTTLFRSLNNKLVELCEPPFEFLELDHHFGQILITFLGRVADVQVSGGGLLQQSHLRRKLRSPLDADELVDACLERTANAVERGENVPDRIDDLGPLRRVLTP